MGLLGSFIAFDVSTSTTGWLAKKFLNLILLGGAALLATSFASEGNWLWFAITVAVAIGAQGVFSVRAYRRRQALARAAEARELQAARRRAELQRMSKAERATAHTKKAASNAGAAAGAAVAVPVAVVAGTGSWAARKVKEARQRRDARDKELIDKYGE